MTNDKYAGLPPEYIELLEQVDREEELARQRSQAQEASHARRPLAEDDDDDYDSYYHRKSWLV
ncbi:hypothetical protein [Nocardia transvalensis]|uniref:hypothetical protein n=1 Tax=Nocardia transvalensis TaxID=37333 RepID=UPI0018936889|nr:hypothetical protein [Nocardia transvalensis]MBF6332339.1 hypothetical protein [Nocardia transvalensis]